MSKQRKKLKCVCKGKELRVYLGIDHQKHIDRCPLAIDNQKGDR